MTEVVIVGGYHDGLAGTVSDAVMELGCIIEKQPGPSGTDEDGWWWGYYDTGSVDADGRHVFSPGPMAGWPKS